MTDSAMFYQQFFTGISAGLLATLLGTVMLLSVGVLFALRPEPFAGEKPPSALKVLTAIGLAIFLIGVLWQVIGYAGYVV
jgi:hypothetical protein